MSDTTEQAPDELTHPDGSPNWARARESLKRYQAEAAELQMLLDREREERRRVEAVPPTR